MAGWGLRSVLVGEGERWWWWGLGRACIFGRRAASLPSSATLANLCFGTTTIGPGCFGSPDPAIVGGGLHSGLCLVFTLGGGNRRRGDWRRPLAHLRLRRAVDDLRRRHGGGRLAGGRGGLRWRDGGGRGFVVEPERVGLLGDRVRTILRLRAATPTVKPEDGQTGSMLRGVYP